MTIEVTPWVDNQNRFIIEYSMSRLSTKLLTTKINPRNHLDYGGILRRKRDSNPRRCDPQQFSRLPHSTTLPFLQKCLLGMP